MADALVAIEDELEGELARTSGTISSELAAAMLGTSKRTLRFWEERFDYPVAVVAGDGRRRYPVGAVIALREALQSELSVAAAVLSASRTSPPELCAPVDP